MYFVEIRLGKVLNIKQLYTVLLHDIMKIRCWLSCCIHVIITLQDLSLICRSSQSIDGSSQSVDQINRFFTALIVFFILTQVHNEENYIQNFYSDKKGLFFISSLLMKHSWLYI